MNTKPQSTPSQADLLQKQIDRLEKEHGPQDRFVRLLKAQRDSLKSQQREPRPNPLTLHVGTRN